MPPPGPPPLPVPPPSGPPPLPRASPTATAEVEATSAAALASDACLSPKAANKLELLRAKKAKKLAAAAVNGDIQPGPPGPPPLRAAAAAALPPPLPPKVGEGGDEDTDGSTACESACESSCAMPAGLSKMEQVKWQRDRRSAGKGATTAPGVAPLPPGLPPPQRSSVGGTPPLSLSLSLAGATAAVAAPSRLKKQGRYRLATQEKLQREHGAILRQILQTLDSKSKRKLNGQSVADSKFTATPLLLVISRSCLRGCLWLQAARHSPRWTQMAPACLTGASLPRP